MPTYHPLTLYPHGAATPVSAAHSLPLFVTTTWVLAVSATPFFSPMAAASPCSHCHDSRPHPHPTAPPKYRPLATAWLAGHVCLLALASRSCLLPPCTVAIWQCPTARLAVASAASRLPHLDNSSRQTPYDHPQL
jgi:hypothetical protein